MRQPVITRSLPATALGLCLIVAPFGWAVAQPYVGGGSRPEWGQRLSSPPRIGGKPFPGPKRLENPRQNQPHLRQWMANHRNLTFKQQQSALEAEPGFRELPPQTQQRMRDRLAQLNALPPQQRERMLENTERMEQLAPQQREQVRSAMSKWNSLQPDRRRAVGQAFRQLRALPPAERTAALEERYRGQFSPEEHDALTSLLGVEPMLPPPANRAQTPQ